MTAPLDIPAQEDAGSRRPGQRVSVRFIPVDKPKDDNQIKAFVRHLARQAAREYASSEKKS